MEVDRNGNVYDDFGNYIGNVNDRYKNYRRQSSMAPAAFLLLLAAVIIAIFLLKGANDPFRDTQAGAGIPVPTEWSTSAGAGTVPVNDPSITENLGASVSAGSTGTGASGSYSRSGSNGSKLDAAGSIGTHNP